MWMLHTGYDVDRWPFRYALPLYHSTVSIVCPSIHLFIYGYKIWHHPFFLWFFFFVRLKWNMNCCCIYVFILIY
ncbi:hypothetical protein BDB00DRAFT_821598 [Zychaea mexicana]|uniref:uncharacterized protein n=1 Tax=Zychaea mexicana TaxID=64656 RepID=UPI0022FF1528|nr:uncharacterized protein BDB00DRAFT_821598 [Zychaea mexicana]KAI9493781.1 hypothetical protein BDB00DRAFT_821598 [Zychaea mexicana]